MAGGTSTTTMTNTTNEYSFTVVAAHNKNKLVYVLDEDDDDGDDEKNHTMPSVMDTSPLIKNVCLGTGVQSFQDCHQLQRELWTLQETLFQGMTQKVVDTQEQVLKLEQEILRLRSELESTRTLWIQEKERNQTLTGLLHHYPPPNHHHHHHIPSSCNDGLLIDCSSWSRGLGVGGLFMFGNDTSLLNLKDHHRGGVSRGNK